jgi:hypothetical protein
VTGEKIRGKMNRHMHRVSTVPLFARLIQPK